MDSKTLALAKFLKVGTDEVDISSYDDNIREAEGKEFLVLTDAEATRQAEEYIKIHVWAFLPSFLIDYMPEGMTEEAIKAIQEKLCEDANDSLISLIGKRFEEFVSDAIDADGRAHFLNTYDDLEEEVSINNTEYYIYRIN